MKLCIELKKRDKTVSVNKSAATIVASSVATLLIQNKQILLGRRFEKKADEKNFIGWQCPGGYLQKGESVEQAAQKFCIQKAGIELTKMHPGPYTNNVFSEQLHTTTLYVIGEGYRVVNRSQFENEQFQWSWFEFDQLPDLLFLPLTFLVPEIKSGCYD